MISRKCLEADAGYMRRTEERIILEKGFVSETCTDIFFSTASGLFFPFFVLDSVSFFFDKYFQHELAVPHG